MKVLKTGTMSDGTLEFDFNSNNEAEIAFNDLLNGIKNLSDFKTHLSKQKYADCI